MKPVPDLPTVRVGIIDYGMGNLRSVGNALRHLNALPILVSGPEQLASVDRLILPGVGAFADGMQQLRARNLVAPLEEQVLQRKKPLLGICLGMQLLLGVGTEHGRSAGLNWIPGVVEKLPVVEHGRFRLPHIGWNDVRFLPPASSGAFQLPESGTFYFVHSYCVRPEDPAVAVGFCTHGTEFVAALQKDNILATQFHPEKSQRAGLQLLRQFLRPEVSRAAA